MLYKVDSLSFDYDRDKDRIGKSNRIEIKLLRLEIGILLSNKAFFVFILCI